LGIACEVVLVYGELVAWGVVNLEVEVAVLDMVGNRDTWTDSWLVFVEYDDDCRPVRGVTDSGFSRRATGAAVFYVRDGNLAGVGFIIGSGCCGVEGGEEAENDSGDGVLHSESLRRYEL